MMTKQQAQDAARVLRSKLRGKGWKIRVWKNVGWEYGATNPPLSVYPSTQSGYYFCLMADAPSDTGYGSTLWEPIHRKDPNRAVALIVAGARKRLDTIIAAVEKAEGIAG